MDHRVYIASAPNAKNEDRSSQTQVSIKDEKVTILGVYDGDMQSTPARNLLVSHSI
jgi:hypothetical protein